VQPNRRSDGRGPAFYRCGREGYGEAGCGRHLGAADPGARLARRDAYFSSGKPILRHGPAVRGGLGSVRRFAQRMGRVQTICDFVHNHIAFGYQHARSTKTAWEAFQERVGVCRDYTHLAVAFCRCMNIPARYCTGYLGDMGMPPPYDPMDFAAWFEVYLGGGWYPFDAGNNVPRIGRILIARGRDAADVAISNTFGPNTLNGFRVWAEEKS
jgi:transglutaminase-like putative cysteine protease